MCATGLFMAKRELTFLNPGKALVDKLTKLVNEGDSEKAFLELQKLFIYENHKEKLTGELISFNKKVIEDKLDDLKPIKKNIFWEGRDRVTIYPYDLKDFPKEGKEAMPPSFKKGKRGKSGGMFLCFGEGKKVDMTKDLMKRDSKNLQHKAAYSLNSLLEFL